MTLDGNGINIVYLQFFEVRKNLGFNYLLLASHGGSFEAVRHVFHIVFNKTGKQDIAASGELVQKGTFIFLCFALGGKPLLHACFFYLSSRYNKN